MVLPQDTLSVPKGNQRTDNTSEATNATSRSASMALAIQQNLTLEELLEQQAVEGTTEVALQRMLSLKSAISTISSFATGQQAAAGMNIEYYMIGKGSIGVVYEHPSTTQCYKLPLLDNPEKLWNNYHMQTKVHEAFITAQRTLGININIEVPKMHWFANKDTAKFWDAKLDKFPSDSTYPRKRRDVLCMERILPLPRPGRHLLVDKYGPATPPSAKSNAKSDPANQDCLVGPLLGRVKHGAGNRVFSLRNFKLHLDQFRELEINTAEYAEAMADAMAVLQGVAKTDAMDIEFVIGSSPSDPSSLSSGDIEKMTPGSSTYEAVTAKDFTHRILGLWVLDFDACAPIAFNQAGAQAAAKGFFGTEPYCPRPANDKDGHALWLSFGQRYMETSAKLGVPSEFSEAFLGGVKVGVRAAQVIPAASSSSAPAYGRGSMASGSGTRGCGGGGGRGDHDRGGGRGNNSRGWSEWSGWFRWSGWSRWAWKKRLQ